jgi:hypothetical protein
MDATANANCLPNVKSNALPYANANALPNANANSKGVFVPNPHL